MASPDFNWYDIPVLQVWRQMVDNSGQSSSLLESYGPEEAIPLMAQALSNHKVSLSHLQILFSFSNTRLALYNIFWKAFHNSIQVQPTLLKCPIYLFSCFCHFPFFCMKYLFRWMNISKCPIYCLMFDRFLVVGPSFPSLWIRRYWNGQK